MNGREWKPEHDRTMRLLNAIGCDDAMIAAHTGHCRITVMRHRQAAQLPTCYGSRLGEWREVANSLLQSKVTTP
jgi:hypothetical protein